jgi:hypothetical protein
MSVLLSGLSFVFMLVHDRAPATLDDSVAAVARHVCARAALPDVGRYDAVYVGGGIRVTGAAAEAFLDDLEHFHASACSLFSGPEPPATQVAEVSIHFDGIGSPG